MFMSKKNAKHLLIHLRVLLSLKNSTKIFLRILWQQLRVQAATNGNFFLFMIKNNFKIHRVNSFKARQFLNSLHIKIKTDNFDAQGLVRYAKERHLDLKIYNIFDEKNEEFRQLMTK
jgi:hypothetical protein